MSKRKRHPIVAPDVEVTSSILHRHYAVDGKGYRTSVTGVSTPVLACRFMAGGTVGTLAADYLLKPSEVANALRWELRPRRTRVRMVERAVSGQK